MLRRLMAFTSTLVFATGTTPLTTDLYSMSNEKLSPVPLSKSSATREPVDEQPKDPGVPVLGANQVLRLLRRTNRMHEVHFAVAKGKIAPIWQKPNPSTQTSADTHTLSSRSGGIQLPHIQADGLGLAVSKLALHFVGASYRWGGTGPSCFDCSGLAFYIYRELGIELPRTTYSQFQAGIPVTMSDLRPGDLVFFDTTGGPSHVAIYIGNGLMVQALNSRTGVIVSNLHASYYAQRYIGARRYTASGYRN